MFATKQHSRDSQLYTHTAPFFKDAGVEAAQSELQKSMGAVTGYNRLFMTWHHCF